MASVETKPQQVNFEQTGIERVSESDRAHTQLWDTVWLWWSANSVVATVALGAISAFAGLGFGGTVLVIVLFNILGVLPVAFLSTLGPKTGLAQMPLTRFAFGLQGAKLPALFNALACIGWSAVNSIIGASLIVAWSAGKIPLPVALIFLAIVTTAVSVFGYFIVHRYERYAWIPMTILFAYVAFAAWGHFNPASVGAGALASPGLLFAGILTFGGAIFGYAIGWSSYAADYTRRQPANTPAGRVFTYAFVGITVPCILLEILGALLATAPGAVPNLVGGLPGPLFVNAMGTGAVASVVLVLLAFSTIANNVPNDYSFALSTQVLGINVKRWALTIVGAVIYVSIALAIFQQGFPGKLQGFLLLIAYWLGAWSIIVIIEHFRRKGEYPVADYQDASKLPTGIAAVVSMVVGLAVAALGINQLETFGYEGILSKHLADADIGFPLAIVVAGVLFYFLRRWEVSRSGR
jgi:NCS1 nucleoside transporter family